ncbi:MAG: hypothetical protein ACYDBQ_11460 [Thermoplasmatota archaeon]
MAAPEARILLDGCDLLALGTIAGFAPDGERVRLAIDSQKPAAICVGIPAEDLATLDQLAGAAGELAEPDALSQRLLDLLGAYGPTRIPSPDLEAAHAAARLGGLPLEAIDIGDEDHSEIYTQSVSFRHVLRSNARYKRLLRKGLPQRPRDAYQLACDWDAATLATASLRAVEERRERHMAERLRDLARLHPRLLAVVPCARFAGVMAHLTPNP